MCGLVGPRWPNGRHHLRAPRAIQLGSEMTAQIGLAPTTDCRSFGRHGLADGVALDAVTGMPPDYILVPGPPVRAASWQATAEHLRKAGLSVQVPDVLAHVLSAPSWRTWTRHLLDHISPGRHTVAVGHSSSCALVADLATKLPMSGLILVDGDIPPTQGAAPPVRPALLEFIRGIADETGMLPPWSRWFAGDAVRASLVGIDILQKDAEEFARFEQALPRLRADWFNDAIELGHWDHVPAGYIQTSQIFDHAAMEARRRGWPVTNLNGTHLDPTLRPVEMSAAITSMTRQLGLVGTI
jgi:Alpha/beta hydrolase family